LGVAWRDHPMTGWNSRTWYKNILFVQQGLKSARKGGLAMSESVSGAMFHFKCDHVSVAVNQTGSKAVDGHQGSPSPMQMGKLGVPP